MLPVGPKPILEHIVEWLKGSGVSDVVVCTGYLGKMISDYFGDGSQWGVRMTYATSLHPLGIAGQLKTAEPSVDGRFVCLYGDAILDFDLRKVVEFHESKKAMATMVLMNYGTELKYGFMKTDKNGRLLEWREKPKIAGFINVGCYVMEKGFFAYIPGGKSYGMKEAFERTKAAGERVYALKVKGEFVDIGDRRSYKAANELYTKKMGKV